MTFLSLKRLALATGTSLALLAVVSASFVPRATAAQVPIDPKPACTYEENVTQLPAGCMEAGINCHGSICCAHYHMAMNVYKCVPGGNEAKGTPTPEYFSGYSEFCGPTACAAVSFASCSHFVRQCRTEACP